MVKELKSLGVSTNIEHDIKKQLCDIRQQSASKKTFSFWITVTGTKAMFIFYSSGQYMTYTCSTTFCALGHLALYFKHEYVLQF